jgi:Tol biopolymer transport system component
VLPRLIAIVALTLLPVPGEESVRQIYERARLLQEQNRKLDEAVRLYGKVVELEKKDRQLAARAQVEQGLLYLRLGRNEEARQAFRKVITDFPDQAAPVREARARLGTAPLPRSVLNMRQAWAGSGADNSGAPSPDGRYLSFTDWSTGNLSVRNMATGEIRPLAHGASGPMQAQALSSVFSPDSKQIAYYWTEDAGGTQQIRVIGLDGAASRVVRALPADGFLKLADWSPDGRYLLAYSKPKGMGSSIALIAVSDGAMRELKQIDEYPGRMSFSRDGRYILYDVDREPGRDISLLPVENGGEIALVRHPADDFSIGWSPDGRRILFGSDRTGSLSLWTLEVSDGRPVGEPRLVREDAGRIEPMGITRNGSFYYWLNTGLMDVYSATVDPERAVVLQPPAAVTRRFLGTNNWPDWSPDGKYLLYQSSRPGPEEVIVIQSLDTGAERELRTHPRFDFGNPRWNAAGDRILVSGLLAEKKGVYRIDPQSGEVSLAAEVPLGNIRQFVPAWSADEKTLFGRFHGFNGIHRMDLSTSDIRTLFRPSDPPGPFAEFDTGPSDVLLSPDGRSLLFQQRDRPRSDNLLIMSPEGGVPRVLLSVKWPEQAFPVGAYAWTPDSQRILFIQRHGDANELWVIPAQGGEPRPFGLRMKSMRTLRLHPDGRRIAFISGDSGGEVWVIENLF